MRVRQTLPAGLRSKLNSRPYSKQYIRESLLSGMIMKLLPGLYFSASCSCDDLADFVIVALGSGVALNGGGGVKPFPRAASSVP